MSTLQLSLLGPPRVMLDGKPLTIPSKKGLALLFYLAVTHQPHTRSQLATLLWDGDEESAKRNLRGEVHRLCKKYGLESYLLVARDTVAFNHESRYELNVEKFEALLHPKCTIEQMQMGVVLYEGDFLQGFEVLGAPEFEEWVVQQQEIFHNLALKTLCKLYDHHKTGKQYTLSIRYAEQALRLEPWLEEAHVCLMEARARSGQQRAALRQYEVCKQVLKKEFGVEPSKGTRELYERIRRGEIGLDSETMDEGMADNKGQVAAPPFQFPPMAKHFIGRFPALTSITKQLTQPDRHNRLALVGMGGVGKTILATHVAHELKNHFTNGILWASDIANEPMAILENWGAAYGHDFSRIPHVEGRVIAFHRLLADKKVLLVVDNVESVARVRPLLPTMPGCAVLLTTRHENVARILQAHIFPVEELTLENGRNLLALLLNDNRVQTEPEAADVICTLLSNLPLAIEITARRLTLSPSRRLADVAHRLRQVKNLLEAEGNHEVRASFELSWGAMDLREQHIFALLGLFEGRSFTAEAVAYVAQMEKYPTEDLLIALIALSLLKEEPGNRYRQHPLLADFAKEKLGENRQEENGRFAAYYLTFAQQHQRQYDTLRPEWGNLMAGMQKAYQHQLWHSVMDYAAALTEPWFRRGRYTQARRGYQWAVNAAQAEQNLAAQAQYLHQWGLACLEQRDFSQATHYLTQSIQIFQTINDLAGIAQSQCDLARIALEQTNYDQAQTLLIDSRDIREELNDSIGIAETLHVEARVYYFRGDHQGAAHLAKQALELLTHPSHEAKTIRTLNLLASISIMQGDLETAESYAQNALQLSERLQDKGDQAMILNVLADVNRRQGHLDRAKTHAEKGLELLKTVGDLGSQAGVLYQLTLIHLAQNQSQTALEFGLQSLELCQLSQSHLQKMWSLIYVGDCYKNLGQETQALKTWQEAWHLAYTLQHPTAIQRLKDRLGDL